MSGLASQLTAPQRRGRLVFVDNRFGNDATGRVERAEFPFATIEAAFNAALAAATSVDDNFTVHVRPGRYFLTYGKMVKPANRTINFEFESGTAIETSGTSPPGTAWLEILGGTCYLSGQDTLRIIVYHDNNSCFLRLNGNNAGNPATAHIYALRIDHIASGSNSAFVHCVATGGHSFCTVKTDYIRNTTSSEGQAFIRWDGTIPFYGAEVYVDIDSMGFRMFYDAPGVPIQLHKFFSKYHNGSIGGLTATDAPVWLEIADGSLLSNLSKPPFPPPLGFRPSSILLGGAINVFSNTTFIPDVIRDQSGYGYAHSLGSVQFGGSVAGQLYTNQFSFQGGYLDADYDVSTSGSIPPGGASPPVGYFIRHQLIKSFFVKGAAGYIGGTGNIAFGTVNLGILTPYVPAASITQNGLSIPLLSAPVGAMITAPSDQLRIFADPTNTANVLVNGHLKIVAELGKAM